MTKSYIAAIGVANPPYSASQEDAARFMNETLGLEGSRRRRLSQLYQATGIRRRHSALADFLRVRGEFEFFSNAADLEPAPDVAQRMALFRAAGVPLAVAAAEDCLRQSDLGDRRAITHLIAVSCTGLYAPGLDIDLVDALRLAPETQRTGVNFMGCYAAFNALKVADACCRADPAARVLIVCLELCTLHFRKHTSLDQLYANALFSDGAAALLVQAQPGPGFSFSLEAFHCDLARDGKDDMAWHITPTGFEMVLTSYVPKLVRGGIRPMADRLLERLGLTLAGIHYFAIHPGGRRILEACEEALGISRDDNRFAYAVLENHGNMSSPTVAFVLREIHAQLERRDRGKNVLSFAFGPGLTLESMLLRIHHV